MSPHVDVHAKDGIGTRAARRETSYPASLYPIPPVLTWQDNRRALRIRGIPLVDCEALSLVDLADTL